MVTFGPLGWVGAGLNSHRAACGASGIRTSRLRTLDSSLNTMLLGGPMQLLRINHLGIATPGLDEAMARMARLFDLARITRRRWPSRR